MVIKFSWICSDNHDKDMVIRADVTVGRNVKKTRKREHGIGESKVM